MSATHPARTLAPMLPDALTSPIHGGLLDTLQRACAANGWDPTAPIVMEVGEGGEGGEGGSGGGADDAAAKATADKAAADQAAADQKAADEAAAAAKKIEFTPEQQAEIGRRIAEERTKAAATAKKAAEDEAKTTAERAKMDEVERLKAENADKDKASADATEKANARVIAAEAKVQAVEAGADPKQLAYVLRLADLTDVKVDETSGDPDAKAIRKVIDKVLADVPALKGEGNGTGRSGGEHNGNGGQAKATTLEEAVTARLGG